MIGRDDEIRRVIQVLSPPHEEQPGADRRARRRQDRDRRGPRPADRLRRRARVAARPPRDRARHRRADRRREVPRRVRGPAEGRPQGDRRRPRAQIILFIDELHTIVGAGAAEGAVDAANLLKPMLARGELRAVGATTLDEYRKHIEKDAALERRFQPVLVGEPSVEDTIAILRGLQGALRGPPRRAHPGLRDRSPPRRSRDRYIADRFLPDKAIDLIDEAASRLRIEIDSLPTEIDEVERRILQLEIEQQALKKETDEASAARREALERELADLRERAAEHEGRAGRPRRRRSTAIRDAKERLEQAPARGSSAPSARPTSSAPPSCATARSPSSRSSSPSRRRALAELAAQGSTLLQGGGRPTRTSPRSSPSGPASRSRRLMEGEVEKLIHMEERLHERVIGQDEAVERRRQRAAPLARRAPGPQPPDRHASCSSARPASARPSWPARWPSSCSTARTRWSASTCREYMEKHTVVAAGRRASRLRRLRGGRPADRGRAPPPVLGRAARRDREGPPRRLQRAAAGAWTTAA